MFSFIILKKDLIEEVRNFLVVLVLLNMTTKFHEILLP